MSICGDNACAGCEYAERCANSDVQTNEEWFCSLSTEEKAEWLTEFAIRFIPCELTVLSKKIKTSKNNTLEWLKQPHSEVEE